jgi:outer membrane immunogenic protein
MKRLVWAISVAGLVGTPAFAADMAVKSAPLAPAPAVYNWTGWYVGVNAGASMGNAKTDFSVAPIASIPDFSGFAGSQTTYPDGFIGGGQIGYNWQASPLWVAGIEADIQYSDERDSFTGSQAFSFTPPLLAILALPTVSGTAAVNLDTKIDWFGTVRGRLGYLWGNGTVLTYVTGGLAYGRVAIAGTGAVTGTVGATPFSVVDSIGHSHVNTGWTLGYGTEGALDFWGAHNWTWKVESLYMDLGHLDAADASGIFSTHTHFTDWILRGGLNYRFY